MNTIDPRLYPEFIETFARLICVLKLCWSKTSCRNVTTSGYSSYTDSQAFFGSQFWPKHSQCPTQDVSSRASQQSSEVRRQAGGTCWWPRGSSESANSHLFGHSPGNRAEAFEPVSHQASPVRRIQGARESTWPTGGLRGGQETSQRPQRQVHFLLLLLAFVSLLKNVVKDEIFQRRPNDCFSFAVRQQPSNGIIYCKRWTMWVRVI